MNPSPKNLGGINADANAMGSPAAPPSCNGRGQQRPIRHALLLGGRCKSSKASEEESPERTRRNPDNGLGSAGISSDVDIEPIKTSESVETPVHSNHSGAATAALGAQPSQGIRPSQNVGTASNAYAGAQDLQQQVGTASNAYAGAQDLQQQLSALDCRQHHDLPQPHQGPQHAQTHQQFSFPLQQLQQQVWATQQILENARQQSYHLLMQQQQRQHQMLQDSSHQSYHQLLLQQSYQQQQVKIMNLELQLCREQQQLQQAHQIQQQPGSFAATSCAHQKGMPQQNNLLPPKPAPASAVEERGGSGHKESIPSDECNHGLNPAGVPTNPIDEELENLLPIEKELAWLTEECALILPPSSNDEIPQNKLVLDFCWKHGSLQLRKYLQKAYPSKISALANQVTSWSSGAVEQSETGLTLVEYNLSSPLQERIRNLRNEARNALRLGYRRSEAIEKELNTILYSRWKEAVEEAGLSGDGKICNPFQPKQSRHRRRRRRSKNEALLETALGQDRDSTAHRQSADVEAAALEVPTELTALEDEVAWLVEESLILLPADMLNTANATTANNPKNGQTKSFMTAGLVTKSKEINWEYVVNNASEDLKCELERIGGVKRRPLQRLIRNHQKETRVAFSKRRDDIASLLLLRGYRRTETMNSLPSHDLLVQTGLNKVWAVRLLRRRQNETSEDIVSMKDLRSACNLRIGGKEHSERSPKRQKQTSGSKESTPAKHTTKLTTTQAATSSILTAEEEEIAWLREEYEAETGVQIYDWEYIEDNSSLPLLIRLAEKEVAPSAFPSKPGVSKLRAMVRLDSPSVKNEYECKRRDIRYAIRQKGFSRDRTQQLPAIPAAPASFDLPPKRKNGTCVIDLEFASSCRKRMDVGDVDDSTREFNESPPEQESSTPDRNDSNRCSNSASYAACGNMSSQAMNGSTAGSNGGANVASHAQQRAEAQSEGVHSEDPPLPDEDNDKDSPALESRLDSFDLNLSGEESGDDALDNDDEEFELPSEEELDDDDLIEE